jgi:hypothetical protein
MPDPNPLLDHVSAVIGAVGALGTAAYGLVDTTKAFAGGVSNAGFSSIRAAIGKLMKDVPKGPAIFDADDMIKTLRANWLNGMAKADQKGAAKAMIRLCLTPENAAKLAAGAGVDPAKLKAVTDKISTGGALDATDMNILGRFDAIVSAMLDEAYEHADQQYRNWAKFCALVIAIILAVVGGWIVFSGNKCAAGAASDKCYSGDYFMVSPLFWTAVLVGIIATPLAPIAKDISSALASAVGAMNLWKR